MHSGMHFECFLVARGLDVLVVPGYKFDKRLMREVHQVLRSSIADQMNVDSFPFSSGKYNIRLPTIWFPSLCDNQTPEWAVSVHEILLHKIQIPDNHLFFFFIKWRFPDEPEMAYFAQLSRSGGTSFTFNRGIP